MNALHVVLGFAFGFGLGAAAIAWMMRALVVDQRRSRERVAATLREVTYELTRCPCADEDCDGPAAAFTPDTCDRCTAVFRSYERLGEPMPPLCSVCKAGPVVRFTDDGEFCEAHRTPPTPLNGQIG